VISFSNPIFVVGFSPFHQDGFHQDMHGSVTKKEVIEVAVWVGEGKRWVPPRWFQKVAVQCPQTET